jgi:hypothetical protein
MTEQEFRELNELRLSFKRIAEKFEIMPYVFPPESHERDLYVWQSKLCNANAGDLGDWLDKKAKEMCLNENT